MEPDNSDNIATAYTRIIELRTLFHSESFATSCYWYYFAIHLSL